MWRFILLQRLRSRFEQDWFIIRPVTLLSRTRRAGACASLLTSRERAMVQRLHRRELVVASASVYHGDGYHALAIRGCSGSRSDGTLRLSR
jgi:chromosome condensin MukBEF ATPase and DNA-binding subunit MukB